jgi:peptide-methionine (S)-S-oxide reductase
VGYTGGRTENPTYHSLGNHTETVEMDYDPTVVSYEDLLKVFWRSHNPRSRSWSRQYMSAVFYHNDKQKKLAMESRDTEAANGGGKISTEILPASTFYRAEDYHQKYYLRQRSDLVRLLKSVYPTEEEFVDSEVAARLNGYLAGYGALADVDKEINSLELPEKVSESILKSLHASLR